MVLLSNGKERCAVQSQLRRAPPQTELPGGEEAASLLGSDPLHSTLDCSSAAIAAEVGGKLLPAVRDAVVTHSGFAATKIEKRIGLNSKPPRGAVSSKERKYALQFTLKLRRKDNLDRNGKLSERDAALYFALLKLGCPVLASMLLAVARGGGATCELRGYLPGVQRGVQCRHEPGEGRRLPRGLGRRPRNERRA